MKIAGIIVEYNPFHNGHCWHAAETRRLCDADAVVAVMSGQFVQRGEAACFDKWVRAEMAVANGVDLVLELPTAFALRSAQFFAAGGVRLFAALGKIEALCFGAENSDLNELQKTATAMQDAKTLESFKRNMKAGHSYAKSLGDALANDALTVLIKQPNNILGIEYLRALQQFAPAIRAVSIQRKASDYHEQTISGKFASATAVRKSLLNSEDYLGAVPPLVASLMQKQIIAGRGPVRQESFAELLLFLLRQKTGTDLKSFLFGSEDGLENRLKEAAKQAYDWESLLAAVATKRYTLGRLQRALLWVLLGVKSDFLAEADLRGPQYARILAFNEKGKAALKELRKSASIPLIDTPASLLKRTAQKYEQQNLSDRMLLLDAAATDVYCLGMPEKKWHTGGADYKHPPVYHVF